MNTKKSTRKETITPVCSCKDTYNGWTNYATWRVNLEIVDGLFSEWSPYNGNEPFKDMQALSQYIKERCEEYLYSGMPGYIDPSLQKCYDFALAFMADVNWNEIAIAVANEFPTTMLDESTTTCHKCGTEIDLDNSSFYPYSDTDDNGEYINTDMCDKPFCDTCAKKINEDKNHD